MIIKKNTMLILISIVIILVAVGINIKLSAKGPLNTKEYSNYEEESLDAVNAECDSTEGEVLSFEMFQISKEKNDIKIIEHLESKIANEQLSEETKSKFETLLVNKSNCLDKENNIRLILESKGYNNTIAIINNDNVRIVSDDELSKEDTVRILDVVINETNFDTSQIKILKFSNMEL